MAECSTFIDGTAVPVLFDRRNARPRYILRALVEHAEADIHQQVTQHLAGRTPCEIATELEAHPDAVRKKLRQERPWSRQDLLAISKLTKRIIKIRPMLGAGA